jgi:hypothetical protein
LSSVVVTDDIVGLITNRIDAGDGDDLLEPGERWLYAATGVAVNLSTSQTGAGRIAGCDPAHTGTTRTAYHNIGTVFSGELTASDPSHYCNPPLPVDELSALGDYVWNDENENGIQDDGESPVAGVTVKLLQPGANGLCDASDAMLATTTTGANGFYLFDNLVAGDYCVLFVLPDGFTFTVVTQGSNPAADSNANPQTGLTAKISLPAGVTDLSWDAGLVVQRTLSLTVESVCQNDTPFIRYTVQTIGFTSPDPTTAVTLTWQTLEGRNAQVVTDLPLDGNSRLLLWPGAVVDGNGDPIDWPGWDQDAHGNWFEVPTDLRPKLRVIVEVNPTASATVDYPPGTPTCSAAPGEEVSALGNYVWLDVNQDGIQDDDEEGVEGVTVKLLTPGENGQCDASDAVLQTTLTDADGLYRFDNLAGGEYCVLFVAPTDFDFTNANEGDDPALDSDADTQTGLTAKIILPLGVTDLSWDAGLFQTNPTAIDPGDQPGAPVKVYLPSLNR